MSSNVPAIDDKLRKPRTPNVEGMSHAMPSQMAGMLVRGQLTPVKNRKGMDVNTTSNITFSRCRTRHESVIPKKITDKR